MSRPINNNLLGDIITWICGCYSSFDINKLYWPQVTTYSNQEDLSAYFFQIMRFRVVRTFQTFARINCLGEELCNFLVSKTLLKTDKIVWYFRVDDCVIIIWYNEVNYIETSDMFIWYNYYLIQWSQLYWNFCYYYLIQWGQSYWNFGCVTYHAKHCFSSFSFECNK